MNYFHLKGSEETTENSIEGESKESSEEKSICNLPKEEGLCHALFQRFYFVDGECLGFSYGGCKGNANNFETYDLCFEACKDLINMEKHNEKGESRKTWKENDPVLHGKITPTVS